MDINYGKEVLLDLQDCNREMFSVEGLDNYITELCATIEMKRYGTPKFWEDNSNTPHLKGVSVMQFIETSNIIIHALDYTASTLINIFSCKDFDIDVMKDFSVKYFGAKNYYINIVERKIKAFDNPKVNLSHGKFGKSLYASENILQGEIIAVFDGETFEAEKSSDLPNDEPQKIRDHVLQFEKNKYRSSNGFAQYINHSCSPNCGIKEKFKIVAMQDIVKGQELTIDYEMTENSDWSMDCECGNNNCRGKVGAFRNLPESRREKYKGYISDWLLTEKG